MSPVLGADVISYAKEGLMFQVTIPEYLPAPSPGPRALSLRSGPPSTTSAIGACKRASIDGRAERPCLSPRAERRQRELPGCGQPPRSRSGVGIPCLVPPLGSAQAPRQRVRYSRGWLPAPEIYVLRRFEDDDVGVELSKDASAPSSPLQERKRAVIWHQSRT